MAATITTTGTGSTAVVRLAGELDLSHVDQLGAAVERALAVRPAGLEVEMAAVTFCDSSILGALVRAHQAAATVGTELVLVSPAPVVRRLLQLSGIDRRIPVAGGGEPADGQASSTG